MDRKNIVFISNYLIDCYVYIPTKEQITFYFYRINKPQANFKNMNSEISRIVQEPQYVWWWCVVYDIKYTWKLKVYTERNPTIKEITICKLDCIHNRILVNWNEEATFCFFMHTLFVIHSWLKLAGFINAVLFTDQLGKKCGL